MHRGSVALLVVGLLVGAAIGAAGSFYLAAPSSASSSSTSSASSTQQAQTLVIATVGGTPAQVELAIAQAWAAKYHPGLNVQVVTFSTSADELIKIKTALAAGQSPGVDIVFTSMADVYTGFNNGEFNYINYQLIPNVGQLIPAAAPLIPGLGPGGVIGTGGMLVWNTTIMKKLGFTPTSWMDLSNPKFKGHVCMQDGIDNDWNWMWSVQLALGGSLNDPNQTQAINWLKTQLLPNSPIFYTGSAAGVALWQQGQCWIGQLWDNRAYSLIRSGAPVAAVIPKEGGFALVTTWEVVNGSKVSDIAQQYINYRISAPVESAYAQETGFAPTNANVVLPNGTYVLPVSQALKLQPFPALLWNQYRSQWATLWQKTVGTG